MTSAYPIDIASLTERVRARAVELGEVPAQRRVMAEFKVGRPKATAALAALAATGFEPTTDAARSERRLHSVGPADTSPVDQPDTDEVVGVVESSQVTDHADAPDAPNDTAPETVPTRAGGRDGTAVVSGAVATRARARSWPLLLLAAGAFVSIWGGWVGLGELTGFGPIRLLPGIADGWVINSAITLPIGVEAYAAFALRVWLSPIGTNPVGPGAGRARRFAMWSAIGSLVLGAAGQVAYHLMTAAGITTAPWPITAFVSCLPVVVLGCGAALAHLLHTDPHTKEDC